MTKTISSAPTKGNTVATARRLTTAVALLLGAAPLLSGCLSLGGDSPEEMISLTADTRAPAGDIGGGAIRDAIVVLDPDADRRLDVARVPVQIDAASIAYLKNATWVEKPARQFRRVLAETIRAKGGRIVVEGSDYEISGKVKLGGRLIDMGYDARQQAVVVRYDAVLEEAGGAVRSRRFESVVPGVATTAKAVAPALNRAANDVATQVAAWVAGG